MDFYILCKEKTGFGSLPTEEPDAILCVPTTKLRRIYYAIHDMWGVGAKIIANGVKWRWVTWSDCEFLQRF